MIDWSSGCVRWVITDQACSTFRAAQCSRALCWCDIINRLQLGYSWLKYFYLLSGENQLLWTLQTFTCRYMLIGIQLSSLQVIDVVRAVWQVYKLNSHAIGDWRLCLTMLRGLWQVLSMHTRVSSLVPVLGECAMLSLAVCVWVVSFFSICHVSLAACNHHIINIQICYTISYGMYNTCIHNCVFVTNHSLINVWALKSSLRCWVHLSCSLTVVQNISRFSIFLQIFTVVHAVNTAKRYRDFSYK